MHSPPQRLILGCGYLGLRVARNWLESGSIVYAVTRTQDRAAKLAARGIKPLLADITNPHSLNELPHVKTLLWSVGFDRSGRSTHHDIHVRGLSNVLEAVPGTPQTIFCSSTGVWGDKGGAEVNEMTPTDPSRSADMFWSKLKHSLRNTDLDLASLFDSLVCTDLIAYRA